MSNTEPTIKATLSEDGTAEITEVATDPETATRLANLTCSLMEENAALRARCKALQDALGIACGTMKGYRR